MSGLCFFMSIKTAVYIDGFNLYYGVLKGTKHKWLDVDQMCQKLLPKNQIVAIKYFTARVSARPHDPQQPQRQALYFRALQTLPNVEIVYGQFLQSKVRMRLANPPASGAKTVEVIKTEEKGSDVNIATHMVHDGHLGRYDMAVIVSNDSDLLEPVKIVRYELNKGVGMLNPQKRPSQVLKKHVHFLKPIRQGVIASSQFPVTLKDTQGKFHKPKKW